MSVTNNILTTLLTLITWCSWEPKTVIDTPAMPENPPETWLTYHLAHPEAEGTATCDPNPAFFWKGRYHLHYIYKHQTGSVLAMFPVTTVHWKWHPCVGPTTMATAWSGTDITKDGRPAMVYFGHKPSETGFPMPWTMEQAHIPHDKDGKPMTDMSYFDPDLWIKDGIYYGLNGRNRRSSAVIMKSDGFRGLGLYRGYFTRLRRGKLGVRKTRAFLCNIFKLGDKWGLCITTLVVAIIGDFKRAFPFKQHGMMNGAPGFHVPIPAEPDGRR